MPLSMKEQLQGQSGEYLPRLVAVMYCVFDPIAGPTVVDQVPEGSVATALSTFPTSSNRNESLERSAIKRSATRGRTPNANQTADLVVRSTSQQRLSSTPVLFDFSPIREFVIPKAELCGHLITKATRTSKILGFPVRIVDEDKYHAGRQTYNRNAFIFNVCFIFERDAELSVFEPIVRKVGRTLRLLEESSSLLSDPPPHFSISNLLEQIYMDLNNFSEASIRIGNVDLELFLSPFYANPKPVKNSDVPLAICALEQMKHPSWDVTLFKICSFINGVNHVRRIAELAEVDLHLARLCIQHLVFYGAIIIVDLFQYTNSYAPLPSISDVVHTLEDEEEDEGVPDLRLECEAYSYTGTSTPLAAGSECPPSRVPFATLLSFYSTLRPGLSVAQWCEQHGLDALPIDVRRMIQFGVIKGFLRRVHAYPIWLDHPAFATSNGEEGEREGGEDRPRLGRDPSSSFFSTASTTSPVSTTHFATDSHISTATTTSAFSASYPRSTRRPSPGLTPLRPILKPSAASMGGSPTPPNFPTSLPLMMDGTHHSDEICVKYSISHKQLEVVFRTLGSAGKGTTGEAGEEEEEDEEDDEGGKRRRRGSGNGSAGIGTEYGERLVVMYV